MAPKYAQRLAAAALVISPLVTAQQPGTSTPEIHPSLPSWKCTTSGGCVQQNTAVVLDWNYRWIHNAAGTSCTTASGGVNTQLCPDEPTCGANCFVEGANYTAAGVSTSGDSLTMYQYVNKENASPRLYLLDSDDGDYVMFQLLGQELTFTVDLSTLPCGENGALYLSEMDATGGRSQYQTGGANYGSGYCDAQCPSETWKNGSLPSGSYCCNEMDILEANSRANAFTPHPCTSTSCDGSGCGYNPYGQGYQSYWGPGLTLDTSQPFTVVTQFITNDGTTTGTLSSINRFYIQNGQKVPTAAPGGDTITESWCTANDGAAASYGGLPTMGEALGRGMVLAFSIWNDAGQYMDWLDSGSAGPCSSTEGNPTNILANDPNTHVVFSNIRWGDIGSTTGGVGSVSSSSSSVKSTTTVLPSSSSTTVKSTTLTTSTASSKSTSTTAPPTGATQSEWGQCGGSGYTGPTACASPYTCSVLNPYYYQCL